MRTVPQSLRETIASNIRECRQRLFPGHGGGKRCAAAFSLYIGRQFSPQQWSPWERGTRIPSEESLQKIAAFFGKTIEYMCTNNTRSAPSAAAATPPVSSYAGLSAPELVMAMGQSRMKAVYQVEISVTSVQFVPCTE